MRYPSSFLSTLFDARALLARMFFASLLVVILTSASSSVALAFQTFGSKAQYHSHTFFTNPNFTDIRSGTPGQQTTALTNGAFDWNNVADFQYVHGGQTNVATVNTGDGVNAIFYVPGSSDAQFGALAIAFMAVDQFNFITGFDIQYFDQSGTQQWDFLYFGQPGNPPQTDFDIWAIATHEFGHTLGLAHTEMADQTISMFASTAQGDPSHRTLHPDDTAGILSIYGPGPFVPRNPGVAVTCGPPQNAPVGATTPLVGAWTITNTGNVPDYYAYQIADNLGWLNPIPPGQTPLLQPGGVFTLAPQPTVTIPGAVPQGTVDNVAFQANSVNLPQLIAGCNTPVTAQQAAYVTGQGIGGIPAGLAFDPGSVLYVADNLNGNIVMVPPGGGAGPFPPIIGGLAQPTGVVMGPNGNLFVADLSGAVYEYMVPSGALVRLVAPPGTFGAPFDLAFCGNDLLVTDGAQLATYALPGAGAGGGGPIPPVFHSGPYPDIFGIAVDPGGIVYVTGGQSGNVYTVLPGQTAPVVWGNTVGGYAMGIALDLAGNVYVAEGQIGGDIDFFNPGGGVPFATIPNSTSGWTWLAFSPSMQAHGPNMSDTLLHTSNTGNIGPPTACQFNVCQFDVALTVGGVNGLLLPNMSSCPVGFQGSVYASNPTIQGLGPSGLAFDPSGNGNLYLADWNAGTVEVVAPGGGQAQPIVNGLPTPRALTMGPNGNFYVLLGDGSLAEYDLGGGYVQDIVPPGTFLDPIDMAWCQLDLLVTDRGDATLYVLPNAGQGPSQPAVFQDGFPDLFGVSTGVQGEIFVSLGSTPQVAMLNQIQAGYQVWVDEPLASSFQGLAVDQNGNVYVADGAAGDLYVYPPSGPPAGLVAVGTLSGETWLAHGFGVQMPGLWESMVYYTSTGVGGPTNNFQFAVGRIDFPGAFGKPVPDTGCGATTSAPESVEWVDDVFRGRELADEFLGAIPNPVSSESRFVFSLERASHVRLEIFGAEGRQVRTLIDESRPAGRYAESWDGLDRVGGRLPNGVYYSRLEVDGRLQQRKFVLAR